MHRAVRGCVIDCRQSGTCVDPVKANEVGVSFTVGHGDRHDLVDKRASRIGGADSDVVAGIGSKSSRLLIGYRNLACRLLIANLPPALSISE